VIVEGVNMIKKHQKPSNANPNGGIIDTEAPIHASNVMLIDPSTNEPTRVGFKVVDGKKVRVAKKSGKQSTNLLRKGGKIFMVNRLKEKYENEITPSLIEKFNYTSVMQAPKIDKIVLNMGVGDATTNAKNLDEAVEELN
jgi:hypothetical protein